MRMVKSFFVLAILMSSFIPGTFAQVKVETTGKVKLGNERSGNDYNNEVTQEILGLGTDTYRTGSKLSFGDYGSGALGGANVYIGEYGTGDSDKVYPRMVERFLNLLFSSAPRMQIQEYANDLNVSQQYLNKSLRQQLGCSANALVQFRILLEAKNQLVFSNSPIKAIAYELGFTELANFYNFFRKNTTLTPNQYRLYLQ